MDPTIKKVIKYMRPIKIVFIILLFSCTTSLSYAQEKNIMIEQALDEAEDRNKGPVEIFIENQQKRPDINEEYPVDIKIETVEESEGKELVDENETEDADQVYTVNHVYILRLHGRNSKNIITKIHGNDLVVSCKLWRYFIYYVLVYIKTA